ncbi:MAG: succinate dehydrogenase assembly factor 2 [Alphaproteobacteria bacterium]|nr:succinate dehydrogenase assembly factor 2 [Alphaproteobacteria bacterium]
MSTAQNGGSSEARRKQLLFRCQRRGFKELDLIFGAFAREHLDTLTAGELDHLDLLLNASDDDVYAWLRGYEAVPERYAFPVFDKLKSVCDRKAPVWIV